MPDPGGRRPRAPVGPGPHRLVPVPVRAASSWTWATSPGMARRFDVPTYLAESAGWNVEKLVNVAAATGRHSIDETLELDRRAEADGHPDAIVGGLPPTDSVAEADRADRPADGGAAVPRASARWAPSTARCPAAEVLRALQERGLLFELMAHPDQLRPAAAGLAAFDDLVVVVEHTGWPRSGADGGARALEGGHGARSPSSATSVVCKLSGLAMPLGSMSADGVRPVDRARHRAVRRRPLHVRQQLPGRRHARHLRRAVLGLRRRHRRPRRRPTATSSSPANAERIYRC